MRQRVALARALAQEADVLLMDEPFGALDAMTRDVLHDELERVWRETGLTVIFVTHNVREAVRLGDRVVLLSSRPGRIVEEYPIEIDRPRRLDSFDVAGLAATITDRLQGRGAPPWPLTNATADRRASTRSRSPVAPRRVAGPADLARHVAEAARDRDRAGRSGSSSTGPNGGRTTRSRRPDEAVQSIFDNWNVIWTAIRNTLSRAVYGYALALVIGTTIGALVARNRCCGPRSGR